MTKPLLDGELIKDLPLLTRTKNALTAAGLDTVGKLRAAPNDSLLITPNLGMGGMKDLAKLGLVECVEMTPAEYWRKVRHATSRRQ